MNAAGFPRNGPWFWRQMLSTNPEIFSKSNQILIRLGKAPLVDKQWINHNPTHEGFAGGRLIHHHVNQGRFATALPEDVHLGWFERLHGVFTGD
jgi:hypothetical protein